MRARKVFHKGWIITAVAGAAALAACGGDDNDLPTLDGKAPLVISHRGLPGLYPEETQMAYEAAADAGGDSLELDLHLTKDCVVVARHNPWLSDNTNIAEVAAKVPEVAARKRTVPGVAVAVKYDVAKYGGPATYLSDLTNPADPKSVLKSLVVDGEDHTGDWSITDFTLAELRQWGINGTTYDARDQRPTTYNGKLPIVSFQEVIDIAKAKSKATGRAISVYPETKNPYWNNAQARANGCPGTQPFEDAVLKVINANNLNSKDAALFVQSFDPPSLKYLRSAGYKGKAVQLIDGNAVDYKTGEMIYVTDDSDNFVSGRPYSWTLAGDGRMFGEMFKPAALAEIKQYADGIGPWKPEVMKLQVNPWPTTAGYKGKLADVNSVTPNSVIADAHKAGLFVHVYTFRNEAKYLAGAFGGDPAKEYLPYLRAGVDGVFTDFTGTAVAARNTYLKEMGR
ncbi:glycerophosphodiester phosphodiesterase family protein [Ottowia sp.]|uniref:glycerophosphodiester phosphodiesterase family protein n=1 Tax=Ottowia sp. TaxID=1898956 RepID=UPI002B58E04E|nr:glycerophosphodiester phosphodiesterase family protein [Ottowia sp.]HOB67080.1 glycerophosphodiester phosphodiesterase family protein [Ottowia sp.]HPZ56294.1 glycerophosphodiester phosphodiesterase family protein [Ottowia sp.]HQD47537.1 glycerophosphodiester phosphodiesterase family protein [Ottowia sp.]